MEIHHEGTSNQLQLIEFNGIPDNFDRYADIHAHKLARMLCVFEENKSFHRVIVVGDDNTQTICAYANSTQVVQHLATSFGRACEDVFARLPLGGRG